MTFFSKKGRGFPTLRFFNHLSLSQLLTIHKQLTWLLIGIVLVGLFGFTSPVLAATSVSDTIAIVSGLFGILGMIIAFAFYLAARQIKDEVLAKVKEVELVQIGELRNMMDSKVLQFVKMQKLTIRNQVLIGVLQERLNDVEQYLESQRSPNGRSFNVRQRFPDNAIPDDTDFE